MSLAVDEKHTNADYRIFKEFLNHPAKSSKSMEDAKRLLSQEGPFTYMLLDCGGTGSSLYLCFYDKQREFYAHFCQVVENGWKNGTGKRLNETGIEQSWKNRTHKIYSTLQELIQAVMGVKSGDETAFIDR